MCNSSGMIVIRSSDVCVVMWLWSFLVWVSCLTGHRYSESGLWLNRDVQVHSLLMTQVGSESPAEAFDGLGNIYACVSRFFCMISQQLQMRCGFWQLQLPKGSGCSVILQRRAFKPWGSATTPYYVWLPVVWSVQFGGDLGWTSAPGTTDPNWESWWYALGGIDLSLWKMSKMDYLCLRF